MLGSSNSIADCNIILNAATAQVLEEFADQLEKADDFQSAMHDLIKQTIIDHKRILFNGNGYDDAWIEDATKNRGLLNLRTTPDAIPALLLKKNKDMLMHQHIYNEIEIESRAEIAYENYNTVIDIEATTMANMARRGILPAVESYTASVASQVSAKKAISPCIACKAETKVVEKLSALTDAIDERTESLEKAIISLEEISDAKTKAEAVRDSILPKMAELRAACDEAETITSKDYWPFPTYGELLFGVR